MVKIIEWLCECGEWIPAQYGSHAHMELNDKLELVLNKTIDKSKIKKWEIKHRKPRDRIRIRIKD